MISENHRKPESIAGSDNINKITNTCGHESTLAIKVT